MPDDIARERVDPGERRRSSRLPLSCDVVVTHRTATWTTRTADVALRGCRIAIERPLAPGTLVQVRFPGEAGAPPHEVVGQVRWASETPQRDAGVQFVAAYQGLPSRASERWLDALLAAQLRRAREEGSLGKVGEIALHLATPPARALTGPELAAVRVARIGGRVGALAHAPGGLDALEGLLREGVLTACGPDRIDRQGWSRALAALSALEAPARAGAAVSAGAPPGPPGRAK